MGWGASLPWWVRWAAIGGTGFVTTCAGVLIEELQWAGLFFGVFLLVVAGGGVLFHFFRPPPKLTEARVREILREEISAALAGRAPTTSSPALGKEDVRAIVAAMIPPPAPAVPSAMVTDVERIGGVVEKHDALLKIALRPALRQHLNNLEVAVFIGRVDEYLEGVKSGAPADDSLLRRLLDRLLRQLKAMGENADAIMTTAKTAQERARIDPLNCTLVGDDQNFWETGAHKLKYKVHEAFWRSITENLHLAFGRLGSLAAVRENDLPAIVDKVKR